MPREPTQHIDETPEQLRDRAGRYRQYACYYYKDSVYAVLNTLASELEASAAQAEAGIRALLTTEKDAA